MLVLTVLRSGGAWTPEDVNHLNYWVSRYAKRYFSFVCLTDLPQKDFFRTIRVVPLLTDMQGWWAKMEVFRRDLPLGPVRWYMDLDMVPIKPIGDMYEAKQPTEFLVLKDLDGTPFSTRMMKWADNIDTSGLFSAAWRYWVENKLDSANWPADRDKVFVEDALAKMNVPTGFLEEAFPEQFVPYKDCLGETGVPEKARWLLFEGGARPKDVSTQWYVEKTKKPGAKYVSASDLGRGAPVISRVG